MDESGRFKKIYDRRTMALPSEDFFTGRIDDTYYIDMDKDTDAGRIYIGQTTLEQLAQLIGWVPGGLAVQQEAELLELRKENAYLRHLITGIRDSAVSLVSSLDQQAEERVSTDVGSEPPQNSPTSDEPGEGARSSATGKKPGGVSSLQL